jgi:hypothetical protein
MDAHSRRIAKQLHQVSRWASVERSMREMSYDEAEIKATLDDLMGAFKQSEEAGQAKWFKVRKRVLRRQADREAHAKAKEVETKVMAAQFAELQGEFADRGRSC